MIKRLSGKKLKLFLKSFRSLSGLLIFLLLITSCRSIPLALPTNESSFKDYLFRTYQSSGSGFFSCEQVDISFIGKDKKSLKGKIFIHRGEFIYANLSFLGFEVGRAEITRDSIKFINRIEKSYLFDRFDELNRVFNSGLSYKQVEGLIINGIAIEKGQSKRKFISHISDSTDFFIVSEEASKSISIKSYFDKKTYKASKIVILNVADSSSVLALINSYYNSESYPESVLLNVRKGDKNFDFEIRIGKISYNKFEKRTFDVSTKYHKILF